ncbi:hypothetical protein T281_11610 [Rhodomicrobium udaipurense JA643]|uniref:TnsA endonuclease N-terminal domain-containing protein n=1 Tax=Rhodomicrobium udaipurense TaxID=1202716 RepID=A0A8I1G8N2_9HYPH|nr:TnsA endonuclease N-terminal domain-containing protein [Rhodomicrobium udaipurense]KAI94320.1 hypothetical protein T281_11610 [Rhodomicrobium udaipurense JA643]MBJ7542583.1 TnsA endonuclease N-terminal domain-containing protein [Rhodomicrobium udaipurense]
MKTATDLDKPRTLEKLEIERRYWLEQGVDWGIVTERDIPKVAVRNIAWVHSYGTLSHINQPYPGYLDEMAEHVLREISAADQAPEGSSAPTSTKAFRSSEERLLCWCAICWRERSSAFRSTSLWMTVWRLSASSRIVSSA